MRGQSVRAVVVRRGGHEVQYRRPKVPRFHPLIPAPLLLLLACNGRSPADDTGPSADTADTAVDADGDGWGAASDCDDGDPTVHPGASETCDDRDEDCDGATDEEAVDAATWYPDADRDGYGDEASPIASCDQPEGTLSTGDDCDDTNAQVHPGASEVCANGLDDDCDPESDWACRWSGVYDLDTIDPTLLSDAGIHSGLGWDIAAGDDWTGGGGLDLAVAAWSAGGVALFQGRPASIDDAFAHVTGLGHAEIVNGLGDLDADGRAELGVVGSDFSTTTLSVLLGPLSAGDQDVADASRLLVEGGSNPGPGGDLDGDLVADLVITIGDDLVVLPGPIAAGTATVSDAVVLVSADPLPSLSSRSGGDISGDGSADLLFVHGSDVVVYVGPLSGGTLDPADADLRIALTADEDVSVLDGGDTNGDGTDDLFVGDGRNSDFRGYAGRVGYFFGGAALAGDLTAYDSDAALYGQYPTMYVGRRIVACDIDGDGLSDTLDGVGHLGDHGSQGMVALYGPPEGNSYGDANWRPLDMTKGVVDVGMQTACAGDLDEDGPEEFLLGCWLCYNQGSVWLFEGMGR
jgi:hypothetical protein